MTTRKKVGVAALVLVALLVGCLGVVGVLRSRTLTLPQPTGQHPVGRTITTVPGGSAAADEALRAAWIWYPAEPGSAPLAEYVPDGWHGSLPPTVGLGWLLQDVDAVRPWARQDARPAAGKHPLVVMAPGFQNAPWMYSSWGEELASRGYVVALLVPVSTPARVVDGQRRSTPDAAEPPKPAEIDELIRQQAADMNALASAIGGEHYRATSSSTARIGSPLAGHVDLTRTVFAGHSLGGSAAVLACAGRTDCAGSINFDGPQPVLPPGLVAKPGLLIGSDRSCAAVSPCSPEGQSEEHVRWVQERRTTTPPTWTATITSAGHNGFGDTAFYFAAPPVSGLTGTGTIAPERMHAAVTAVFGAAIPALRDGKSPRLDLPDLTTTMR
ncbi:hypothetical protein [Allokutzneria sp. NRRL B-24872]|uniref:alpha/beta hydrolase n=1 Tax=Allokutzneria sp. NRRL B-24872 TaxID=1137961 RepID=UPI000A3CDD54|nr:hypothetical protein [Allokutzneria sp. NRRL B-24872]